MIDLIDVSLQYDKSTTALHNINLRIESGEFVFIVGPSGSGKSSLIKLLHRTRKATSGIVRVGGDNLAKLSQRKLPYYRRRLGVVFQDFKLIKNLNVYENIALALRVTNQPRKFIRQRVPYTLNLLEMSRKARKYPNELSGGEQQRVAIARAIVNDPVIIIADEPTGNVDPQLSYDIVELLQGINKCGTTIIMVTHDHELVNTFGGRRIVIDRGRIVFDGVVDPEQYIEEN